MNMQKLLRVSQQLTQAAYDSSLWDSAMATFNHMFDGCGVNFAYNMMTVSGVCDNYYENLYKNALWSHDMLSSSMLCAPTGSIKSDEMIVSKQELHQSIIFNEWLAPQDAHSTLQVKAFAQGQCSGVFTLARGGSQPKFSRQDIATMQVLLPTLQNVAMLYHKFGQIRLEQHSQTLSKTHLGLILVNPSAQILFCNPFALQLLEHSMCPLWIKNKKLESRYLMNGKRLQQHLAKLIDMKVLTTGQEFLLPMEDDSHSFLSVFISPFSDAQQFSIFSPHVVSLLIRQVGLEYGTESKIRLMSLFAFSPQEALIAVYLLKGLSLQQAAELQHISITTARTYLSRIFTKTNTHQQSHLLCLLTQVLQRHYWDKT